MLQEHQHQRSTVWEKKTLWFVYCRSDISLTKILYIWRVHIVQLISSVFLACSSEKSTLYFRRIELAKSPHLAACLDNIFASMLDSLVIIILQHCLMGLSCFPAILYLYKQFYQQDVQFGKSGTQELNIRWLTI